MPSEMSRPGASTRPSVKSIRTSPGRSEPFAGSNWALSYTPSSGPSPDLSSQPPLPPPPPPPPPRVRLGRGQVARREQFVVAGFEVEHEVDGGGEALVPVLPEQIAVGRWQEAVRRERA